MTKKHAKKIKQRKMILATIIAIILLTTCAAILLLKPVANSRETGQSFTITGTAVCLPHKDTSGPQTMECAYGLKDEKGRFYALQDTDPAYKNIIGIPMNTRVTIGGTFEKTSDSKYDTVGTINVTSVAK